VPARRRDPSLDALLACARAATRRRRLRLRYVDANAEVTSREVDVLGLAFREDHWLLAAFCHLRGGFRLFRTERIRSPRVTGRGARPAGAVPFDARAFAAAAWAGGPSAPRATVRLGPDLEPAWTSLFPGSLSELLPDGSRLCHVRDPWVAGLAALVASLGSRAALLRARDLAPSSAAAPRGGPLG